VSFPLTNYLFFSLSMIAAIAMLVEGCLIVLLRKQITPLPTRVLYGLGVLLVGKEKSSRQFSGRTSPKDLRSYATYVLVLGTLLLSSSFVYLFTTVL
jgi:hypothetical protein